MLKSKYNSLYSTMLSTAILYAREDDAGASEAAAAQAKATADAEVQRRIDEAVSAATGGLKAKNDELLGKLKTTSDKLKTFDGFDPVAAKELRDRLDQDEDAKLFAEGKKHEVIEKHTQRMRAAHQEEIAARDELIKTEQARSEKYRGSVLDAQILSVTGGLHKGAVEDALLHARSLFTLDADGKAVQLANGQVVLGKDGSTPFGPAEWIELQKETKPHWFPASTSGSGAGATREASGNGKTIKRGDFEKLPSSDQAKIAVSGIQIID